MTRYIDRHSHAKEANVLSIYRAFRHFTKDQLATLRVMCLSGPQLRDVLFLVRLGVAAANITVVEMNPETLRKQRQKMVEEQCRELLSGLTLVGPKTIGDHLTSCPDAELPDVLYLDVFGNWSGSRLVFPMADLYEFLARVRSMKRKVVVALTFPLRNNYRRGNREVRDTVVRALRLRKRGQNPPGENTIAETFLRKCVFPHSGWQPVATKVSIYQQKAGGQLMMFLRFALTRARRNEAVDWPLVDGQFVGFPPEGDRWTIHSVVDL